MRHGGLVVALLWIAGALMAQEAASGHEGTEEAVAKAVDKARQAASAFTQELLATLLSEMRAGGPLRALTVCSVKAQELARAYSQDGVTVRRVTLKPRNPANRPDEVEESQLVLLVHRWEKGKNATETADWIQEGNRLMVRYMRPITVGDLCLTCHGPVEKLDPQVRAFLAEHYPEDKAVGYKVGDFRGAVSVTVVEDLGGSKP